MLQVAASRASMTARLQRPLAARNNDGGWQQCTWCVVQCDVGVWLWER